MEGFKFVGFTDETVQFADANPEQQLNRFLFNVSKVDRMETAKLYYNDPTSRAEILESMLLTYAPRIGQAAANAMVRDAEMGHIYLQLTRDEPQVSLLYQRIEPEA